MKLIFATIIAVFCLNTSFATEGEPQEPTAIEDTVLVPDSIAVTDSLEIKKQKEGANPEEDTHWERGDPNYLFIILPLVLVGVVIVVLKWKKKES